MAPDKYTYTLLVPGGKARVEHFVKSAVTAAEALKTFSKEYAFSLPSKGKDKSKKTLAEVTMPKGSRIQPEALVLYALSDAVVVFNQGGARSGDLRTTGKVYIVQNGNTTVLKDTCAPRAAIRLYCEDEENPLIDVRVFGVGASGKRIDDNIKRHPADLGSDFEISSLGGVVDKFPGEGRGVREMLHEQYMAFVEAENVGPFAPWKTELVKLDKDLSGELGLKVAQYRSLARRTVNGSGQFAANTITIEALAAQSHEGMWSGTAPGKRTNSATVNVKSITLSHPTLSAALTRTISSSPIVYNTAFVNGALALEAREDGSVEEKRFFDDWWQQCRADPVQPWTGSQKDFFNSVRQAFKNSGRLAAGQEVEKRKKVATGTKVIFAAEEDLAIAEYAVANSLAGPDPFPGLAGHLVAIKVRPSVVRDVPSLRSHVKHSALTLAAKMFLFGASEPLELLPASMTSGLSKEDVIKVAQCTLETSLPDKKKKASHYRAVTSGPRADHQPRNMNRSRAPVAAGPVADTLPAARKLTYNNLAAQAVREGQHAKSSKGPAKKRQLPVIDDDSGEETDSRPPSSPVRGPSSPRQSSARQREVQMNEGSSADGNVTEAQHGREASSSTHSQLISGSQLGGSSSSNASSSGKHVREEENSSRKQRRKIAGATYVFISDEE